MLKSLAILSVLLSIAQAGAPIPRMAANQEGTTSQSKQNDAPKGQNTPQAAAPLAALKQDNGLAYDAYAQSEGGKGEWDKAGILANYLLVIVGIAGVLVAIYTLNKLSQQTKASEDAAKAALLNVQAFINSERPWIMVKVEPSKLSGEREFDVIAVNKGRTPGTIISHAESCIVIDPVATNYETFFPPCPPKYGKPILNSQIILPEESIRICEVSQKWIVEAGYSESDVAKFRANDVETYVFGTVTYRELLGPNSATYETQWCCYMLPMTDPDGVLLHPAKIDGYTQHT